MKTTLTNKVCSYIRRSICKQTVRETQQSSGNTVRLCCFIVKSAVERLTRVRQAMSRDYSALCTIATSDCEAMYAYKCDEYEKCLQLCQQNVNQTCFS